MRSPCSGRLILKKTTMNITSLEAINNAIFLLLILTDNNMVLDEVFIFLYNVK
jgi:hypothetical protein